MSKKRKPDDDLADAPQLKPIGKSSGKGKGLQKYFQSNAVKASAAGVLVLALVLVIGWQIFSGGSETKPARTTASVSTAQAQAAPPPMPEVPTDTSPATPEQKDAPADQNVQAGQESTQNQSPEIQAEPAQSEQPQPQPGGHGRGTTRETVPGAENASTQPNFPDDISKWQKGDFMRARQENNPKLLEAVAYLGEKFPGKEQVAQGLADMLKTPKSSDPNAIYSQTTMPGLLEAVIEALGRNGSPAARETLKQILSGKITTDDDSRAVDAVLKTLVQIPSAENEKIIVQVITSPEQIRPATTQGAIQPATMRSSALELVKQNPSEGLTLKLAENLVQKGPEPNDPVMDFLLQDNPAFLNAQLLLYKSEELNPDTKAKLEQYFLNRSSQAIGMTMGIPSGIEGTASAPGSTWTIPQSSGRDIRMSPPGPGSANAETTPGEAAKDKPTTDYERGAYLAKLLWNEPLVGLLSEHLADVRLLDRSSQDIVLASTLPLNSIRAGMFKMLKKRMGDSPQPLETAGWSDKVLNDPGLLVVMKLLPRSKTIKTAPIAARPRARL